MVYPAAAEGQQTAGRLVAVQILLPVSSFVDGKGKELTCPQVVTLVKQQQQGTGGLVQGHQ